MQTPDTTPALAIVSLMPTRHGVDQSINRGHMGNENGRPVAVSIAIRANAVTWQHAIGSRYSIRAGYHGNCSAVPVFLHVAPSISTLGLGRWFRTDYGVAFVDGI